ncbi:MAG: DUF4974 domain-containing protein [Melioribacter sp.]|nr:DUF4974 domain-containing protein [Melioribacter sp.]
MNNHDFLKLVDKYLRGECLPDEELLLEKYLESFQNENTNWNENELDNKQLTEEKIYSEVMQKIRNKEKNVIQRIFYSPNLIKIAASIILFISLATGGLYFSGIFKDRPAVIAWNETETLMGEKNIITLADNSVITLNADSKLKYPRSFLNGKREIYLEGEAYFEIQHDTSKPFIVHTGDLSTTVLGTKFNVSAFAADKDISVSLVEGSVKVSKIEAGVEENIVLLQPAQQLLFDKEKKLGKIELFDDQETVGWKDDILKFDNQPLVKIFVVLERRFGIKFEVTDKSYYNRKITANFQKETLWTVTEVIRKLTGLQYKTIKENNETKRIVFYKK